MDYLSELEKELYNFTSKVFEGVSRINAQQFEEPQGKEQSIHSLGAEIAAAHHSVIGAISKIPEDLFKNTREQQEGEIKELEEQYQEAAQRLAKVQERAKFLEGQLEDCLDSLTPT